MEKKCCDNCQYYNWYYDWCNKWKCEIDFRSCCDEYAGVAQWQSVSRLGVRVLSPAPMCDWPSPRGKEIKITDEA